MRSRSSAEEALANDARLPRIVLVLVVGAGLTVTLAGVRSMQEIAAPTFLALVLTIAAHPLRARLARSKLPEWAASLITLLTTYLVILAVCLMLLVSLGRLAVLLPRYEPEMTDILQSLGARLENLGVGAAQVDTTVRAFDVSGLVPFATDLLSGALSGLSNVLFIATLLLFMAFDSSATTRALQALAPAKPDLVGALRSFAAGTRSYMGASAGFGLVVAIIDALALWSMGVPGAFVWGVLAFVTNFVPNIGFVIGVIPPALIALLEGGPGLMLAVVAVYCLINFVIQSVIQPRVIGDRVGLSTTITFLSLVFWTWVVGPLGAILAVPLTLLLRAVLVEADPSAWWVLPLMSGKASGETSNQGGARHPKRRKPAVPARTAGIDDSASESAVPTPTPFTSSSTARADGRDKSVQHGGYRSHARIISTRRAHHPPRRQPDSDLTDAWSYTDQDLVQARAASELGTHLAQTPTSMSRTQAPTAYRPPGLPPQNSALLQVTVGFRGQTHVAQTPTPESATKAPTAYQPPGPPCQNSALSAGHSRFSAGHAQVTSGQTQSDATASPRRELATE